MNYSVKELAYRYVEWLSTKPIDVKAPIAQPFDPSTYNEYEYLKLIKHFDKLYNLIDTVELTEQFLKGD